MYHAENWGNPESLDPGIKVKDILMEYEIPTMMSRSGKQPKYRRNTVYNQ